MKKLICFLPAILIMCIIFFFSSQEAEGSTQTSTSFGRGLIMMKCTILHEKITDDQLEEQAIYIDHAVRKTAHATEYMVLAISLCIPLILLDFSWISKFNRYLISLLTTVVYACTDEIHQLFVKGRSGQISDVIVDSLGGVVGVLFVRLVFSIIEGRKNKNVRIG